MGEIAGQHRKRGVGLMPVDVGDRRIQPGARVEAIERRAGICEMRVGEVDELEGHGACQDRWRTGASGKTTLTGG
ncbi:hypothetical protein [Bradyrhizobium sp. RDT46]|uniref:hypothetical protein n=1 Tax=Bradyrhizobium sp. RDT46 TaxID=3341829 RepID=UPI0035C7748E